MGLYVAPAVVPPSPVVAELMTAFTGPDVTDKTWLAVSDDTLKTSQLKAAIKDAAGRIGKRTAFVLRGDALYVRVYAPRAVKTTTEALETAKAPAKQK